MNDNITSRSEGKEGGKGSWTRGCGDRQGEEGCGGVVEEGSSADLFVVAV